MISIITTLYNYARYLPQLADSVFQQTYMDWQWIIVDDASTDGSEEVVNEIQERERPYSPYIVYQEILYLRLPKNCGYSVAKNVGIRAARGNEYFVMIDADDMLTPDSLEVRLKVLEENPDKLWVHGEALNLNLDGEIEDTYIQWNNTRRKGFIEQGLDLTTWYHHRLVHAQTVMMRREFYEKLGLYDESLRFSSDNEMWRRAIRFGHIPAYIPVPVSIYRVHPKRMSRSEYKKKRIQDTKRYIIEIVERRFKEGLDATGTPRL